jgi:hypothetical protein
MRKIIKRSLIVLSALVILSICYVAGYMEGVFVGTARGLITAVAELVPVGHSLHRKYIPPAVEMLDKNIEDVVIELKSLQNHLGRSDSKLLATCKSMLQRYHRDHPDAIKNTEVLKWLE